MAPCIKCNLLLLIQGSQLAGEYPGQYIAIFLVFWAWASSIGFWDQPFLAWCFLASEAWTVTRNPCSNSSCHHLVSPTLALALSHSYHFTA